MIRNPIKKVVLGICGSIAAYKSIDLAKALIQEGFEVDIVLSTSAPDFVSVLTLRSLFPGKVHLHNAELDSQDAMLHITLAKGADLILIAPASANVISKLAHGGASCLLSTLCLATEALVIIAPAMNKVMWKNSILQSNIKKLEEYGIQIIGPACGIQACGDYGYGRMLEPLEILEHVKALSLPRLLENKKILITAGPTREKIDPVRFLSNYSSGKMGYELAKVAALMGANVTLISGTTNLAAPHNVKLISVSSAEDMLSACLDEAPLAGILISTAAVADYSPEVYHGQKIKKTGEQLNIQLKKTTDILAHIKKSFSSLFCVGFAAETNNLEEYGTRKLKEKLLDMIVINDVSDDKVFGKDHNEVHVIMKNDQHFFLERDTKHNIARKLLEIIANNGQ